MTATTSRPLKERQREEREQLILQAAEELFVEQGYHETSMEQIAARVGIAKGTLYLHFASKEDLIIALFERHLLHFFTTVEAKLTQAASPRERLSAVLETAYGGMTGQRFQMLAVISESADLRGRIAAKKHEMAAVWEDLSRRISAALDEGKAAGDFDATMPTPVMLRLFLSLLMSRGTTSLAHDEQGPTELAAQVSRFFFKGIAATVPDEQSRS